MIRAAIAIASMTMLAACAGTNPIEIKTAPVQQNVVQPADPRAPELTNITWRVITKDQLDGFITELSRKQGTNDPVFVAISMNDYEALSLNLAELKRYIDQQKAIIVYYKGVTAPR